MPQNRRKYRADNRHGLSSPAIFFLIELASAIPSSLLAARRVNSEVSVIPRSGANPYFSGCDGKRGLAWSNHEPSLVPLFASSHMCFIYDWGESIQSGMTVPTSIYYIPMLWGLNNEAQFAKKVVNGYAKFAAGMDEPGISSQSNMSPQDGANLWNKHFCALKPQGYTLLSPATGKGVQWLKDFKTAGACDTQWDIMAGHIYTTSSSDFKKIATSYATAFNKPVAITEWACQDYSGSGAQCSSSQILSFMGYVMTFMDKDDRFVGYAMLGLMTSSELSAININPLNAMITDDGTGLTTVGEYYVNAVL